MNNYIFKYNAIYRGDDTNYMDEVGIVADSVYMAQKVFDIFCYDADILIINNLNIIQTTGGDKNE